MKHLLLIAALLLSGCESMTIRLGAVHDFTRSIQGDNPMAILEVSVPVSETVDCGWTHISHFTSGAPFNDRYEQNADTLGCYWRIK